MPNPFEGRWFVAFSVMRNRFGLSEGHPLGKKGQLLISTPEPNRIALELTHPGNPLRPVTTFTGELNEGPPASFKASGSGNTDTAVSLQGFLTDELKRRIVGGYVRATIGPPGGESDGEGSWVASDETPPAPKAKA